MGELYIVEEAACWERKFMLFKVYLRQSVGMSSRPKPYFRNKRRFLSKIANFSHPVHFALTQKGLPLELGTLQESEKKLEWWRYQMLENLLTYV